VQAACSCRQQQCWRVAAALQQQVLQLAQGHASSSSSYMVSACGEGKASIYVSWHAGQWLRCSPYTYAAAGKP
jgi:hypothetical protein